MRHALIQKYPQHEARIASLMSRMYKSAYRTIIDNVKDMLTQSYFDFTE